ncbi:MAG: FAD:protein FMN transferase [Candidatus Dactylopiibacterium sp.]|nr:FAD:protein FMN transferase [Candidatus Dactylopiibacterium sp.]
MQHSAPRALRVLRLVLALFSLCWLSACGDGPLVRQESFVFGTRVEVVSFGTPEAQARTALSLVLREFDRLHRRYHAWQESDLTRLNAAFANGRSEEVGDEMLFLLQRAQEYARRGDGLFEPAIGHLITLWGFHGDSFTPRRPDPAALRAQTAARPRVTDLRIDGHRVSSANRAVALDLGGIVKGYALDRAAQILREHGVRNALINIGGNVMALGSKGGQPWMVGIQHPREAGPIGTLPLYDGEAIGTSGDYQRFFELDGQRFSHLIDPATGEPAHHTQAVTVLVTPRAQAGLVSDVASKPIFLAGDAGWREMARRCGVDDVMRVDAAGRIFLTAGLQGRLRWAPGMHADSVLE